MERTALKLGHQFAEFGWRKGRKDFVATSMRFIRLSRPDPVWGAVYVEYLGPSGEALAVAGRFYKSLSPKQLAAFDSLMERGKVSAAIRTVLAPAAHP